MLFKYEHWFTISITYTVLERQSSQLGRIWTQRNFKNPNFPTLYWVYSQLFISNSFLTFPQILRIYQCAGINIFSIRNSVHTPEVLTLGKALLILLPFFLLMLKMEMITQKDNYYYRKGVVNQVNQVYSVGLKFRNPKLNILW